MFQPVSLDADGRLRAYCVTAQCSYEWFLQATSGAEANLEIQRAVIKGKKAYATLREDLKRGCVLPPIVLSAAEVPIPHYLTNFSDSLPEAQVESALSDLTLTLRELQPSNVYIIDGLQRTNAIRQIDSEMEGADRAAFRQRKVRVELWLNIPFGAVAYRMLLLNAGQRPMSMKHQIEVLSAKLGEGIRDIEGIDIFTVGDERRRTRPGQFQLAKVSQAFQAWLQGQPNVDIRNVVMEELLAENALETLGLALQQPGATGDGSGFRRVMEWVVTADRALGAAHLSFFGNETVLQGFAAAVGACERKKVISERVWPALDSLLHEITNSAASDPCGIDRFNALRSGFDTSKVNVGVATRDLVFNAFQELFFAGGIAMRSMNECWEVAAARAG